MFASMYICAQGVCKAQEGHQICLELELQMYVNYHWVELRASPSAFNHWIFSPALDNAILKSPSMNSSQEIPKLTIFCESQYLLFSLSMSKLDWRKYVQ